jgi:hypothetical protein
MCRVWLYTRGFGYDYCVHNARAVAGQDGIIRTRTVSKHCGFF